MISSEDLSTPRVVGACTCVSYIEDGQRGRFDRKHEDDRHADALRRVVYRVLPHENDMHAEHTFACQSVTISIWVIRAMWKLHSHVSDWDSSGWAA